MMLLKPKDQKRKRHDVVDGIRKWKDKTTGEEREECLTPASKTRRRREIYDRDKGRCVKCGMKLDFNAEPLARNSMHWSHKTPKRMGGGYTNDSMKNGESLCRDCHLVGEHGQF